MLNELLYQNLDLYVVQKNKDVYGNIIQIIYPKNLNIACRKNKFRNSTKKLSNGMVKVLPNVFKIYIETNLTISEGDVIFLEGIYYDILHVYKVNAQVGFNHIQIIAKKVTSKMENEQYLLHEDITLILTEDTNELIILE